MGFEDDRVLLRGPGRFLNAWVEMVVPPLTALLPDAALEVSSNK